MAAPTPTKYKEIKGWKLATPRDWVDRGDWWSFYRDPKLAFLLKQVEISNQTVAAAAASYEQARALIREAQAALFPTVTASYTYTRTRTGPSAHSINPRFRELHGVRPQPVMTPMMWDTKGPQRGSLYPT